MPAKGHCSEQAARLPEDMLSVATCHDTQGFKLLSIKTLIMMTAKKCSTLGASMPSVQAAHLSICLPLEFHRMTLLSRPALASCECVWS